MHNFDLILTLTAGLAVALVFGYVTHRLGLSPILGYLLAGLVVGPHTPGYVADADLAEQMAEIGVILLMFGVGLHFHLEDLWAVRRVAVPGAIAQSLTATILGAALAVAFGWDWRAGIVFGLALSVASTVVLTRVLSDNRDLHTPTGHIAIGWLVVEDIFTVVVLVLLPALAPGEGNGGAGILIPLGLAILKIAGLVLILFVVGGRVIPWVMSRAAATNSRELFTLTVLVAALGIAVGSAKLFNVSMALGAFLAGMVVGRSDFSLRAATEALPMRDAFAVLFFVSVGMLLNPRYLIEAPLFLAATLAIVLVGKPLAALVIVLLLRYPPKVAFAVAVALAQIGEFSFILAALAKQLRMIPPEATDALVAAAIVSITLNPLLYKLVDPFERWAASHPRLWQRLTARARQRLPGTGPVPQADPELRAVVVGYGPVGRTVVRLLRENEIEPTVIELNLDTVTRLRADGLPAVYGDANHAETLRQAGIDRARALILSASGLSGTEEVIRVAKEINPEVRILVRSAYLRERPALRKAGADAVFAGEGEVALAMTEAILTALGASPEQIDRERARLRADLIGEVPSTMKSADDSTSEQIASTDRSRNSLPQVLPPKTDGSGPLDHG
jgi:CPA2 family monovalent cation:H+ antiporter-2